MADRDQVLRSGERVAITPKAVRLLVALIERRERHVSKDELMKVVWPDLFVEEGNVKFQISIIRRTFGPDIVQTVGKLGYQFGAILEPLDGMDVATNLPARLPALIGRDADVEFLHGMLLEHPLVTLVGTGGVGKTTLAKSVGRRLLDRLGGGVWFLDFPAMLDSGAIASALASLIGADLGRTTDPVGGLARAIAGQRLMFILDGCEPIRASIAAVVGALIEAAPGLCVLATSRIPLRVAGERLLRLEPLETEGPAETALQAAKIPAVALFLDRAEAADAKFVLDDRDAAKAARLCRSLSGLPLALEIVGSRIPVLGFDALSDRLAEFSLKDSDPLQRALDLSWSLLTVRGREALPRFSVFGGSFDLDAARALADATLTEHDLLGAIGELADHSLLAVERGRVPRYRLLDTTRAFAAAHLTPAAGERLNRLAGGHFAAKLAAADDAWNTRNEADWRDELLPDLDSLRGALAWAFGAAGDPTLGVTLSGRSAQLWIALSLLGEGQQWLERAISGLKTTACPPSAEAAIWRGLAALLMFSDGDRAVKAFARAALLYRRAQETYGEGRALAGQGMMQMMAGAPARAERTLGRAQELLAKGQRAKSYGFCVGALAFVYSSTDRIAEAVRALEDGLDAIRASRDVLMIAQTEFNLAELALLTGDVSAAVQRGEAASEHLRAARNPRLLAWGLKNLAIYYEAFGDDARAAQIAAEALPLARPRGDEVLVGVLELAALLGVAASPLLSARLIGWVDATKLRQTRPRQPSEVAIYEKLLPALRNRVPPLRLQEAMADGAHWTDAEAARAAEDLLSAPEETHERAPPVLRLTSAT